MADVFISYHEKSAGELAEQIADALQDAGISSWCARRDLPFGGNFAREIPSQIDACRLFLLILTESVYQSEHIENEVGIAFSRRNNKENIQIVPLELGDFTRKEWVQYYLIHTQSVKFPAQPDEQRIQRLVKRIAKNLNPSAQPQPITPAITSQPTTPAKIIKSGKCAYKVTYTLNENGVLTIAGNGPMWDFTLTGSTPWGEESEKILSVKIQNGITKIGICAFYSCTKLTSVSISNSVTSIGWNAFVGCKNLTSINIPDSVAFIGTLAFYGCEKLTSVSVPAKAKIEDDAFPDTVRVTRRE